jgi:hypothetical protein
MGDEAEQQFVATTTDAHEIFGLRRPNLHVGSLPNILRYMPDYLTQHSLVEVQGIGKDRLIKIKWAKYYALQQWDRIHPVELFVWDRHAQTTSRFRLQQIVEQVETGNIEIGVFPEGHRWFALRA